MASKDLIAIAGIGVTLVVSCANLLYSIWNNKRTIFVNTVTTSRLKWIDSLREEVSEFIATTALIIDPTFTLEAKILGEMLLKRDMLLHQIVLHLNPGDPEDKRMRSLVDHIRDLSEHRKDSHEPRNGLAELRDATGIYLKKEWNRVKKESGEQGS